MAELLAANQITIAKVLDGEKGEMSAEQLAQLNQASEDASQAKSDVANAAKVATNFLGYDSTNGLIIGNKTSGTWSGYRSQILPGSFNVLDASSTALASFGPTTIIGEEANANLHLTFNNLSMVDKNGTKFFEVGDNRNAEGIATVKYKDTGYVYPDTGSAVVVVYSRILSIVSVYVDSVELSSSEYSFSGQKVTINNLTPNTIINVEITYTTLNPYFYLTFGNRLPSSEIGMYSVAEGRDVTASGYASHAEGMDTIASEQYSHAEGCNTTASSARAHAEGYNTTASGNESHAEGYNTTASSGGAHAEGRGTTASHSGAHAEGGGTTANGNYSHAEGYYTTANGNYSHAEGYYTTANGQYSHAGGYYTKADGNYMTAIGKYNTEKSGKAFVIGNGTSDTACSDAFAVDWNGNTVMKGGLALGTALSIANGGTDATSLAGAQENLGIKAISERIDNLILGTGTSPVEVQDARLSSDGTRYPTLKSRLDAENSELKSDLSKQKSDSGYEVIDVKWNKNKILVTDTGQVDVNFEYPLTGWSYCILDCHEGDAFIINGNSGTSNPHAWYFADSEYSLISRSYAENYVYNDYLVYAPKNATKLIIHTKSEKNIYCGYFPKWMIPKQATPEMFGANGDGISNDTNALKKCFASTFDTIRLDKQYLVNEPIDCIGKNVIGTGCIVFESSETLKQGIKFTDCNVNGITFKSVNDKTSVWLENGDGKFYSNIFVWSVNSEFKNCRFENLEDLRDDGSVITDKFIVDKCTFVGCSEGIVATNCEDIRIQNCNIKCLTYAGDLAHCIYISGGCNYTIIEDCVLGGSDMYPIQTYNSKSGLANPNNVKISGCTINNVKSAIATNAKNTVISNCVISCRETFVFADGEHLDVISNNIECRYILYNIEENIARLLGNIIKCNNLASTVNIIKLYSAGNMYIKAGEQGSFMYAGQKEISMLFNNDSFIGFKSSSALFVGEDGWVRIIGCYIQEDISIIWRKQSYFKVYMINNTIDGTASIVDESVVTNNNNVKIDTGKR